MSVLGFTGVQEELYRIVLRNSGSSLSAIAPMLGTTVPQLRERLAPVLAAGLVEINGHTVVAVSPDLALARLITDETRRLRSVGEQLEALRGLLPTLTAEHLTSTAPKGDPVTLERVEAGDVAQLIRSLSASSTGELLWLRPDPWLLLHSREIDEWVVDLVRAGRRSRAIYPSRILEAAPDAVRARSEAGEHVRVLADVPFRIAIMGSSGALMSESFGVHDARLVIRQSAMIGALTMLFENLWERAMPVPGLDGSSRGDRASDRRMLLDQLAAGAKDEQIARALGLSLRTVRRRVADVLEELGAGSRFEAGVEAVRRGWL
jgi:DNA-binding Lrp family transcriptional regulator